MRHDQLKRLRANEVASSDWSLLIVCFACIHTEVGPTILLAFCTGTGDCIPESPVRLDSAAFGRVVLSCAYIIVLHFE